MSIKYRPEIDGLRAIAVLSVIIYHLGWTVGTHKILPGGYFGVDIFFVISGYLITGVLLNEFSNTGRINFQRFYIKRIRRIVPLELFVILTCIPAAYYIMMPSELTRFARSAAATVLFFSNFFWYSELGEYGAQSALLQPLLHTWSLSIEEQFYLFFPVGIYFLYNVNSGLFRFIFLAAIIIISFVLCVFTTFLKESFSFFSTTSRCWELLCGAFVASCAPLLNLSKICNYLRSVLLLTALVCVGFFLVFQNLEDSNHPGMSTLPIVFLSCILIAFTERKDLISRVLGNKIFSFVGQHSYSLYLWHYPIFAFGRLNAIDDPTVFNFALWLLLTFVFSVVSTSIIERPFRFQISIVRFCSIMSVLVFAIFCFSAIVVYTNGLSYRFKEIVARVGKDNFDAEALGLATNSILSDLSPGEDIGPWNAGTPSRHELNDCWFSKSKSHKVLIIGNSHSKDMFNAFYQNQYLFPKFEFARLAFEADMPIAQFERMLQTPNFLQADIILIAPKYRTTSILALDGYIKIIRNLDKNVILIGQDAQFVSPSTLSLFDWYMWRTSASSPNYKEVNSIAYKYESPQARSFSKKVEELAEKTRVRFYDRRGLTCSDDDKTCILVTKDGNRTMFDSDHWTLKGAKYFGEVAASNGWLSEFK